MQPLAKTIDTPGISLLGETLNDAELRFDAVVESLAEGLAIFDVSGEIQYCNSLFEELTGYSFEEMRGKRIYEIFFPPGSPEQDEYFQVMLSRYRARQDGIAEVYQSFIYRKDGKRRWVETKAAPLRDRNGRILGSIGANTDITERKLLQEQLLWSQRLEAVGRLAGGVAHDFNNLLTAIYGFSELVLRTLAPSDPNYRRLLAIRDSSDSACRLTKQLLTLSRRTNVSRERLSLSGLVLDSLEILRGLCGDRIQIRTELGVTATIVADAAQLQQVLVNLVINARDAIVNRGEITVRTSTEQLTAVSDSIESKLPCGSYIVLEVRDTGSGIEPALLSRLFEPFFTTKPGVGTGLGLSTSYALVQQLGGDIIATSEPGAGSTFKVYIPQADEEVAISERQQGPSVWLDGTECVLVVEDEPTIRRLIVEVLEQNGYRVLEAAGGEEALRVLSSAEALPDLVLSDVGMPGTDGLELFQALQRSARQLPVLLMSGYSEEDQTLDTVLRSNIPLLRKPFTPIQLLSALRETLREFHKREKLALRPSRS